MKLTLFLIASALGLTMSTANAQFAKAEDAIKYRQSSFSVMGTHFSRIGAVVKGEKTFNKDEVIANAAIVATMASLPWQGFSQGTEGGRSLPELWKEADKFKAGSEKMQKAIADLNIAAKSGDLDRIKKSFGEAGQTCKSCHDNYRKK